MPVLLDTCVLLWITNSPDKLSKAALERLRSSGPQHVVAISAFEIVVKHHKGKLELPMDPWEWFSQVMEHYGLQEIPISAKVAAMAPRIQVPHKDPCDRIIIATALENNLEILSSDTLIRQCEQVDVIW